jgi:diguanylate cyclase (GGDEF)-like protein/PAS domain S-box-containing protein
MSSNQTSMTSGAPTLAQRLQSPGILATGLTLAAAAVGLSSSSPSLSCAFWVGACGAAAWWGRSGADRGSSNSPHGATFGTGAAVAGAGSLLPNACADSDLVARAFAHSVAPMVITDAMDRIVLINPAYARLCGAEPKALLGQSAELLGMAPLRPSHLHGIETALRDGGRWSGESSLRDASNTKHELWLVVSTLRDADQRITHHIRMFQNIEPLKAQLRAMAEQARMDSLTNLPNRRAFSEHLFQAMARTRRYPKTLAVMSVDLDGFKAVNDTHGHAVGDQLLQHVARRLGACVRATDIVCRLGGDEFMVILEGAGMPHEVELIGKRILTCLSEAYTLGGHHIKATPSIGVVIHQADESEQNLLRRADATMYAAKHAGKARMILDTGGAKEAPHAQPQALHNEAA